MIDIERGGNEEDNRDAELTGMTWSERITQNHENWVEQQTRYGFSTELPSELKHEYEEAVRNAEKRDKGEPISETAEARLRDYMISHSLTTKKESLPTAEEEQALGELKEKITKRQQESQG